MIFREYSPKDKTAVLGLLCEFRDYLIDMDLLKRLRRLPGYETIELAKLQKDVRKKHGKFFLAVDEEKVVGFIVGVILSQTKDEALYLKPSVIGRVTDLFVTASSRGKGIGHELMKEMEEYFLQEKCDTMFVEVFEPNMKAQDFYRQHGFVERTRDLIKVLNAA